jgi:hypothetical protein
VASVADVSETHSVSVFMVDVSRLLITFPIVYRTVAQQLAANTKGGLTSLILLDNFP